MSRKNFIVTALIINLTICLTLCVVLFTDKNPSDKNITENNESTQILENSTTTGNGEITAEETTGDTIEGNITEEKTTEAQTTENRYQPSTVPQPATNNQTTTLPVIQMEQPTTAPQETTVAINGTTATIKSSCNIRSSTDVGGNVLGTAGAGNTYVIDTARCTENWIAIQLGNGEIGYVASSYCDIQ